MEACAEIVRTHNLEERLGVHTPGRIKVRASLLEGMHGSPNPVYGSNARNKRENCVVADKMN